MVGVDPPSPSSVPATVGDIFPLLLILAGIVIAVVIVGVLLKRWWRRPDEQPVGFSLSDLREMHAAGDLTDVEFRSARDAMVSSLKRQMKASSKDTTK